MKKLLSLLIISLFIFLSVNAQYIPRGMNYQAVARDKSGEILAGKEIFLRINLQNQSATSPVIYFSEIHRVVTNELGLFNMIIGKGSTVSGNFNAIPWSSEEIWMAVAIKVSGDNDYISLSSTKLLAVPYAFHAGTANEVIGYYNPYVGPVDGSAGDNSTLTANPVPSANWSLKGNQGTNPPSDYVGTNDLKDLVFKTNSLTRLVITKTGDINITNSLSVGLDLSVGRNVELNTSGTGTTNNHGPFNVTNSSPTTLSGTLRVDDDATFKKHVAIDNATLGSSSSTTGALTVAGGVGIGENENVGGNENVTGTSDVTGATNLHSTLSVTGATTLSSTLGVTGTTTLSSTLGVTGATTLSSTLGVTGVTTLNNKLNANGQVTISTSVSGGQSSYGAYPLRVEGSDQGIAVKVTNTTPGNSNNFVTFLNSGGGAVGCIEGQTLGEFHSSFDFIFETTFFSLDEALTVAQCVAASISIPPDVAEAAVQGLEAADVAAHYATWEINKDANVGVAFTSGGADYAEWLEKGSAGELFSFGDIVGEKGGKISKSMSDPERFMVVSKRPIVLGNMPPTGKENNFEKIAFLGQVDVKVRGSVSIGDYIIASELNDGFGIAVSPLEITSDQYARIVGVAWSESKSGAANSMINVAVGINANDFALKMKQQEMESLSMKKQLNTVVAYLKAKDPNFDATLFDVPVPAKTNTGNSQPAQSQNVITMKTGQSSIANVIAQLESNPDLLKQIQADARRSLDEKGINYNLYDQTRRLVTDDKYFISLLKNNHK